MKRPALLLLLFFAFLCTQAQTLYSNTFGNRQHPPVIFIHGGPGGNSIQFEATTAQKLADKGFFVIVYDRRGESRSPDSNAKINYQEAFDDLNSIYAKYHLTKASLIGFSFGGLVTTLYTTQYAEKVKAVVLVSALFSQQETYNHILDSVQKIYTIKKDLQKLQKVAYVKGLDKNSVEYRKECFALAGENGFFKVAKPAAEAQRIYSEYEASMACKNDIRNKKAPELFYKNEPRVNINVQPILAGFKKKNIPLYAIYGKQDGIFSIPMINNLKAIVGSNHFRYLDNCSHYLYADQQTAFLQSIADWLK